MEGDNRRISVYDLTGLRVHPNGYRVHQTQNNLSLGKYGRNVQGSRGWIADDAGGSIAIPKYRSGRPTPSSEAGEAEYIQMEETGTSREDGEAESEAEESGSAKGKRRKKQNNMAPIKRRKFFQDDSYISGLSQVAGSSGAGLEIPSQDLLKNIHYLAAKYYDERGLLVNTAKRYREAKKLRKLQKLGRSSEPTPERTRSTQSPDASDMEQIATENDLDTRRRHVSRDMYRALDGSVLVAIGVLTQEIVKKLVASKRRSKRTDDDSDDSVENLGEEESVELMEAEERGGSDSESVDGTEEEPCESGEEDESGSEG